MISIFNRLSVKEGAAEKIVKRFANSWETRRVPGLRFDGGPALRLYPAAENNGRVHRRGRAASIHRDAQRKGLLGKLDLSGVRGP